MTPNRGRQIGFLVLWVAIVVSLSAAGHDAVPHAQAFIRGATVPLAIAALMQAFEGFRFDRLSATRFAVPALLALPAIQFAYFLGRAWIAELTLAGMFAYGLFLKDGGVALGPPRDTVLGLLMALVASELTFQYIDYPVHRIDPIPASAIVACLRLTAAVVVLMASIVVAIVAGRAADRLRDEAAETAALVVIACVQVAYFYIDWFPNPGMRFVHVAGVVIGAIAAVAVTKGALRLGPLTAIGLLGILCLQFAYFYRDYHKGLQSGDRGTAEGSSGTLIVDTRNALKDQQAATIFRLQSQRSFASNRRVNAAAVPTRIFVTRPAG